MNTLARSFLVICVFCGFISCGSVASVDAADQLVYGTSKEAMERCVELWEESLQAIRSNRLDETREISRSRRESNCDGVAMKYAIAQTDLDNSRTQLLRFYSLRSAAKTAFEAEHMDQAEAFANELLELSEIYQDDWNFGNAVHDGNMVLGRIALTKGQLEEAKYYLIEASRTPGSPQLNSFGPNLSLAHDLLTAGETEIVVEYLENCKVFWNANPVLSDVESWIVLIRGGIIPNFRANLSI